MNEEFESLGLVELIELLEEVPEPPAIPLTPQTPGWIVLGAIVLLAGGLLVMRIVRYRRENAYRRAALRELTAAGEDPAQIAGILRRAALTAYPRRDVAGLAGADWLAFLERTCPGMEIADTAGAGIAEAAYREVRATPGLSALARQWIRGHRRPEQAR